MNTIGFVFVCEVGKEGDLVGRAHDGKCAIVRGNVELGEIWLGVLEPMTTFYFFKPLKKLAKVF